MPSFISTVAILALASSTVSASESCYILINTISTIVNGASAPYTHNHVYIDYTSTSILPSRTSITEDTTASYSNHSHTVASGLIYLDKVTPYTPLITHNGQCLTVAADRLTVTPCIQNDSTQLFKLSTPAFKSEGVHSIQSVAKPNLFISLNRSFDAIQVRAKAGGYSDFQVKPCEGIVTGDILNVPRVLAASSLTSTDVASPSTTVAPSSFFRR
ncbi:hypothetical protein BC829DRAFT_387240 [Chytridium lagenaria]|nr:hypothetical protein BC829DRAFT_387240 [Chytridium lagenaria]